MTTQKKEAPVKETSTHIVPRKTRTVKIERKNKEGRVTATFDYAKVSARVAEFNLTHTNGSIRTQYTNENGWTLFRATIIPDVKIPERYFTGTSLGKLGSEKALEKLETIAVGRALAFAGFLSDGEIASSEEMDKYQETITLLEEEEVIDASTQLESAHDFEELKKIWKSFPQSYRDNAILLNLKNKLKSKYENSSSETTQPGVAEPTEGENNRNGTSEDSGDSSSIQES